MTPEQTLAQIRQKDNVVVLLISEEDELCVRSKQTLQTQEGRLRARGFHVAVLSVSQKTNGSEELACVRVPQLRFFTKGKLQHKVTGIFNESDIDSALKVLV